MSKFRELAIEALFESTQELDEGKFGKFLGTMATAAAIGLGGVGTGNEAMAGWFNSNQSGAEQVIRTKFDDPIPGWVKEAGNLYSDNGKIYFTSAVNNSGDNNNTAMLERVAESRARLQLLNKLSDIINQNLDGMNKIGDNFTLSTSAPDKRFFYVTKGKDGIKYHAFARLRVDQAALENSLVAAVKKANPNMNQGKIQQIVKSAINSAIN